MSASHLAWYTARASGYTALMMLTLSMVVGLVLAIVIDLATVDARPADAACATLGGAHVLEGRADRGAIGLQEPDRETCDPRVTAN